MGEYTCTHFRFRAIAGSCWPMEFKLPKMFAFLFCSVMWFVWNGLSRKPAVGWNSKTVAASVEPVSNLLVNVCADGRCGDDNDWHHGHVAVSCSSLAVSCPRRHCCVYSRLCAWHSVYDTGTFPHSFVIVTILHHHRTSCYSNGSIGLHRSRHNDRSTEFTRWHQCAPSSNAWLLGLSRFQPVVPNRWTVRYPMPYNVFQWAGNPQNWPFLGGFGPPSNTWFIWPTLISSSVFTHSWFFSDDLSIADVNCCCRVGCMCSSWWITTVLDSVFLSLPSLSALLSTGYMVCHMSTAIVVMSLIAKTSVFGA